MLYTFEDFILDPNRRELTRGAEAISVGPQVFDLLLYLVENRAKVVSKDDLLDVVWAGRIVSESTLTSHINAARKAIGDSGQDQRLIRTIARKGFRFVGDVREEGRPSGVVHLDGMPAATPVTSHSPELPAKPSLAVLPFLNLSGDPAQDYFIDGVVEDIVSALSRMRWLFVIARNSSFAYKGQSVDVKQVGRDLGVRYVLEGSMRKVERRVRITGQLIDATTGGHIWAERFEGTLDDIFDLQDQLTGDVVGAIAPQLERAEIERAQRKQTESLDAYDCYLRAVACFHRGTRQGIDDALPLLYRSMALDPDYAASYGMAAWCYFWRKINGWMADRPREMSEGGRLARRAVELGRDDAVALTRGGHALGHFGGDIDACIDLLDRALVLDPNLAAAWYLSGFQRITRGDHDEAIARFGRAMRLSPFDPEMVRMQAGTGLALLLAGRPDEAVLWAERARRDLPSFMLAVAIVAAGHALAGRTDAAQQAAQQLRKLDPTLRVSNLQERILLHRPEDVTTLRDGLRRAGLTE